MSKSSGDFLTVSTLKERGYSPLAYRYFLLSAHYRKELKFSFEALDAASVAYKKLTDFVATNKYLQGKSNEQYEKEVLVALSQDLATPEAVAVVWKLMKDAMVSEADRLATLMRISEMLGLGLENVEEAKTIEIPEVVRALLKKREEVRKAKDFKQSDELRDEIATHGFIVSDTQEGQKIASRV
jgi:cysteinyl-tRNA synthetase